MQNYQHQKLSKRILKLSESQNIEAEDKIQAKVDEHLDLLRDDAKSEELIVYGSVQPPIFIHAVAINKKHLSSDRNDLLEWNDTPFYGSAGYVQAGNDIWIEKNGISGSKTLEAAQRLLFGRHFENVSDEWEFEILQDYAHLTDIYWCPEQNAYCRLNEDGDFDHIVSITKSKKDGMELVLFKREPLDKYLAISNSVLVRMFDFDLTLQKNDKELESVIHKDNISYRQNIYHGNTLNIRGVQIISPLCSKSMILEKENGLGRKQNSYVKFEAYDWRNKCIKRISTDPSATTNYFQASKNSLPYELSPAFFKPDVLVKYKRERDKYTISERDISCRGAWHLQRIDINEAGQVHAYICDLRMLPHKEQLYWRSCNEKPKAGISERALSHDFKGEFHNYHLSPIQKLLLILRNWTESKAAWWKPDNKMLTKGIVAPSPDNRSDWARTFSDLSKLVIEGFQTKAIQGKLRKMNIPFEKEGSLKLLEKLLLPHNESNDAASLKGLKEVQRIRNKTDHRSDRKADALAENALKEHGDYASHFQHVCAIIINELELIKEAFCKN